jgi:hypothetical protein
MILEPLSYGHYRLLKPYFADQRHRLSAYCLPSIIAWQTRFYQPQFALDGDWLILAAEFFRQPEKRHLLLPINPGVEPEPDQLHRLARGLGFDCYWFVPEAYLQSRLSSGLERYFTISEQDGFHDYIYRRSDLAELSGGRYHKKRNLIRQFTDEYVQAGRVLLAPIEPGDVPACLAFLEEWCARRDCGVEDEEDDLSCEKIAAINALQHLHDVDADGLLVRIDGQVCAMAIGAHLTADMGVLMFEKAFAEFKGLYQYLDRACARQLYEKVAFINKESDMSLPGLIQAKRSYHPVAMSKSYLLTVR